MKKIYFMYCLIAVMVFATITPNFVQAQGNDKDRALGESVLYNLDTGKLEIVKDRANELYNFDESELDFYNAIFESLTIEETNELLLAQGIEVENYEGEVLYLENEDGEVQPYAVMAWLAGIGLVTAIGYFYWDKYLTYKIKQNLINQCYAYGGTPIFDSRDYSGFSGNPENNSNYYTISTEGGYNFACQKP